MTDREQIRAFVAQLDELLQTCPNDRTYGGHLACLQILSFIGVLPPTPALPATLMAALVAQRTALIARASAMEAYNMAWGHWARADHPEVVATTLAADTASEAAKQARSVLREVLLSWSPPAAHEAP